MFTLAYRLGMAGEEGEGVQGVSFLIIAEQEVKQTFLFVCCVGW